MDDGETLMDEYTLELDLSGVAAPAYLLRAKQAMDVLEPGQTLCIVTTATSAVKDFEAWSLQSGNPLLVKQVLSGKFRFVMVKT
jgi:tRNA 2-thiouridine synthesizing protein A